MKLKNVKPLIPLVLILLTSTNLWAQYSKLGYFEATGLYGMIQVECDPVQQNTFVNLIISDRSHFDTIPFVDFQHRNLSFSVAYKPLNIELDFKGEHKNGQFEGTVIAGTNNHQLITGTWKLFSRKDSGDLQRILPSPTGTSKIGKVVLHVTHPSRKELFANNKNDLKEIILQVWYPTTDIAGKSSGYFNDIEHLSSAFSSVSFYEKIRQLNSNSFFNAKPVSNKKFPVIVFSPGGGINCSWYTTLLENIASNNYVVIAIDHTYEENKLRLANGDLVSYRPGNEQDFLAFVKGQIMKRLDDIRFIVTQLQQRIGSQFPEALLKISDVNRIGIFGHSRGGIAVSEVIKKDKRIRACMNYDGAVLGAPFYYFAGSDHVNVPFAWFRRFHQKPDTATLNSWKLTELESNQNLERIYSRAFSMLEENQSTSYILTLDKANHMDFSDLPLFTASRLENVAQWVRNHKIIAHHTIGFFNLYLKKNRSADLNGFNKQFPEISIQVVK